MLTRRGFLSKSTAALAAVAGSTYALAELVRKTEPDHPGLPDGSASRGMITPAAQQAIDDGLTYLARSQADDGSFGTGQHRGNVAITSLAALAMMAGGHQPGRSTHGRVVSGALDYVLSQEDRKVPGYLHNEGSPSHSPMYSHGFGTLFLAEVYGMVHQRRQQQELRNTLERAIHLILTSQNRTGGWRYGPDSQDADISVTICQIMALRAARNAGFSVPKENADHCIDYVKKCQDQDTGAFRYMTMGGNFGSSFARTAAGVVALYSAGLYKDPVIDKGLEYLMHNHKPGRDRLPNSDVHYFYGHYYAVQAMWTAGGTYWSLWYPAIRDELLGHNRLRADGSWPDQICTHYGTAMACIILQVPNNYLPIFER